MIPKENLSLLEKALAYAWCEETTKNWRPENPASGHCAVTALVVQDYLGGEILSAQAALPNGQKESHYWNKIEEEEIDLTKKQFPEDTYIPVGRPKLQGMKEGKSIGPFRSTKDYILQFEDTVQRYQKLRERVLMFLLKYNHSG